MNIKCIGCLKLHREEIELHGKPLIVYRCDRFPYAAVISGLLRPGKGIQKAAKDCHEDPLSHCVLCSKPPAGKYGAPGIAATCSEHHEAWGKWIDEHPDFHSRVAPRGRAVKANWIDAFREFIEEARSCQ